MRSHAKNLIGSAICAVLLFASSDVLAEDSPTSTPGNSSQTASNSDSQSSVRKTDLPNGLYLVFNESAEESQLKPVGQQQTIVYDYEFFPQADRDPACYLTISMEEYIPLKLANEPQKEKDTQGKPKLLLQLANDQIKPLEEFTTRNLGKAVAIVIGSKVVTKHKIKEAIKGGKMQITRCSDNGCDILYTQLQQPSR